MKHHLTTQHGTTKNNKGCEFTYTMCGSYMERIDIDTLRLFREYTEKIYIADHNKGLRANSLKELKSLVSAN